MSGPDETQIPLELLFKSDTDWWNNAYITREPDKMWVYAHSYKLAADKLVQYVNEHEQKQDYLVFPIVFLYRHSIELWLKHIIELGNALYDVDEGFPKSHLIDRLWQEARKVAEKAWPTAPREELEEVEAYLKVLHSIDPGSFAFRYPTNKDGAPSLPDITYVNLRHFSEVANKIDELLSGISMGLSAFLDFKREEESEMRRHYGC